MKTPLIVVTSLLIGLAFADGMFALGMTDEVYGLLGLGIIGTYVWMWVVYAKGS